jgi:hypothetical protein
MRLQHKLSFFVIFALIVMRFGSASNSSDALSMEHKLQHIETNGGSAHPDSTPTTLTESEINAYFASGKIKLPDGVQSVHFAGEAGVVTGKARVDFDQVKTGKNSSNPLLSMFSGIHDVEVEAHAHGVAGTGYVDVDSVVLDGVEIPRFVLQLFVEKYLQPKHPEIGLNSRFQLPDKIDTATVGKHVLVVKQK